MKKSMAISFIFTMMLITSCSDEPGSVRLGDIEQVKIHQSIKYSDAYIRVKLDSVLNDSRCPVDAECFWEGNAAVRFEITTGNVVRKVILNTTLSPKSAQINDYNIELISLMPFSKSGSILKQSDYYAEIKLQKIENQ
jgi:hypothetical protein